VSVVAWRKIVSKKKKKTRNQRRRQVFYVPTVKSPRRVGSGSIPGDAAIAVDQ